MVYVPACTCAQNVCYVIYGMLDVIIVEEIQHVSKLCDKNIKKKLQIPSVCIIKLHLQVRTCKYFSIKKKIYIYICVYSSFVTNS